MYQNLSKKLNSRQNPTLFKAAQNSLQASIAHVLRHGRVAQLAVDLAAPRELAPARGLHHLRNRPVALPAAEPVAPRRRLEVAPDNIVVAMVTHPALIVAGGPGGAQVYQVGVAPELPLALPLRHRPSVLPQNVDLKIIKKTFKDTRFYIAF